MTIAPMDTFEYYKGDIYWNNFEDVLGHQNTLISGDPDIYWIDYIKREFGTFDVGLFPNCGNGWVDRDFFLRKITKETIGFDISETLIIAAKTEAKKMGMPSCYFIQDVNSFDPTEIRCDIVVNVGAMHHVAYIDRMTRSIAKVLKHGGIYVGMDYVGAHRNQYPWRIWKHLVEFNETLPAKYRRFQRYAHLKTMLATDPTEAIHSELQIGVLRRYFDLCQYVPLGGAIAYQILFENRLLFSERHTEEGGEVVKRIIRQDQQFLEKSPEDTLFAFWVATPRRDVLRNTGLQYHWTREEEERERKAAKNGGRYYPVTALEIIYDEISDLTTRAQPA